MADRDLFDIPTRELVAEVIRRAPMCRNGHPAFPMMEIKAEWWTCPVCSQTVDYPTKEGL